MIQGLQDICMVPNTDPPVNPHLSLVIASKRSMSSSIIMLNNSHYNSSLLIPLLEGLGELLNVINVAFLVLGDGVKSHPTCYLPSFCLMLAELQKCLLLAFPS